MPDPVLILKGVAAAGTAAAIVLLLFRSSPGNPRPQRAALGWIVAIAVGFFLGAAVLGFRPRWSIREDQDRLLVLVWPALISVALAGAFPLPRLLLYSLRLLVALGIAPALLWGTSYLTDVAGPGTREWSPTSAALILGSLGAVLLSEAVLLRRLAQRKQNPSVIAALAITSGAAAVTVMLSGYASGGQSGLPLSAALAGAFLAAVLLGGPTLRTTSGTATGLALGGLFSLLVIGRFFGELQTVHAILLFLAPLTGWIGELRWLSGAKYRLREVVPLALLIALVAGVAIDAQRRFAAASGPSSTPGSAEPSLDDYLGS